VRVERAWCNLLVHPINMIEKPVIINIAFPHQPIL